MNFKIPKDIFTIYIKIASHTNKKNNISNILIYFLYTYILFLYNDNIGIKKLK